MALEVTISRIADWHGLQVSYEPIGGGITNSNFRVCVEHPYAEYFVKIPGRGTENFIDREVANAAANMAGEAGMGPRVHHFFRDSGVEVSEFVKSFRSCNNFDFQRRNIRGMAVDLYKRFHAGPLLDQTKTIFDMIDEHIEQAKRANITFPPDAVWLDCQYRLAKSSLEASGIDLRPCFNDPMPMNFMVNPTEDKMILIDYEYASNNDRCYDLGVWFGEMFFEEPVERELIERYFGQVYEATYARCQLHKALSDIKWGYWSLIQMKQSLLPFDFCKYGAWKFQRARSVMHDWRWEKWLRLI